jgi:hypothetical protein
MYQSDIVGILSYFGDLVSEVEVCELCDVAGFVIVDWFCLGGE